MKRTILTFSMTFLLLIIGMNMAKAQEQPKPKKDTVNMDTDAKPQFYYAVEDDKANDKGNKKSGSQVTLILAGAFGLALVGGAAYFFLKKKK